VTGGTGSTGSSGSTGETGPTGSAPGTTNSTGLVALSFGTVSDFALRKIGDDVFVWFELVLTDILEPGYPAAVAMITDANYCSDIQYVPGSAFVKDTYQFLNVVITDCIISFTVPTAGYEMFPGTLIFAELNYERMT